MIDGKDSFNVTVLGAITHIETQSTNTAITLTDGTEEIAVKIWASEEGRPNGDLEKKIKDFQKGAYVKIFGRPQLYRGTRSITCYRLEIVRDSNELTLHFVEALYAHLMNTSVNSSAKTELNTSVTVNNTNNNNYLKSNSDSSNLPTRNSLNSLGHPLTGNNTSLSGSNAVRNINTHLSGGLFGAGDVDIDENEMSDLEKKIIAVVKNPVYSTTEGGCHINEVFRTLKDNMNDIKEAMQRLSDDGQLYSTIDDEHFKPTH